MRGTRSLLLDTVRKLNGGSTKPTPNNAGLQPDPNEERIPAIQRFPSEILVQIFAHLILDNVARVTYQLLDTGSAYRMQYDLMSVCRRWRDAILHESSFWTLISVIAPTGGIARLLRSSLRIPAKDVSHVTKHTQLSLARSKQRPLHIEFSSHGWDFVSNSKLFRLLLPHYDRWESLSMNCRPFQVYSYYFNGPLPSLKSLGMRSYVQAGVESLEPPFGITLDAPNLRQLTLENVPVMISSAWSNIPALEDLSLIYRRFVSYGVFMTQMKRLSHIVRLDLNMLLDSRTLPQHFAPGQCRLPNLKRITFRKSFLWIIFTCPKLEEVVVDGCGSLTGLSVFIYRSRLLKLLEVSFSYTGEQLERELSQDFVHALIRAPNLEKLIVHVHINKDKDQDKLNGFEPNEIALALLNLVLVADTPDQSTLLHCLQLTELDLHLKGIKKDFLRHLVKLRGAESASPLKKLTVYRGTIDDDEYADDRDAYLDDEFLAELRGIIRPDPRDDDSASVEFHPATGQVPRSDEVVALKALIESALGSVRDQGRKPRSGRRR